MTDGTTAVAGVMLADRASPAAVARARAADGLGFERFHLADLGMDAMDQWVLLGALAETTDRIRIGLVTNPYTRTPAVTANAVQTLQELSGGRAFVCLSRGGDRILGGAGARATQPLQTMRAAIAAMRERNPGVETWVATKGPRMLELALELADGVLLSGVPLVLLPSLVDDLRRDAARAVNIGVSVACAGNPRSRDDARMRIALELTDMRDDFREAADVPDELVDAVRETMLGGASLPRAATLVPDELVDRFALEASPDDLPQRIAVLRRTSGVDFVEVSGFCVFDEAGGLLAPGFGALDEHRGAEQNDHSVDRERLR